METKIIRTLVYDCLCDIISEENDGNNKCDICGKKSENENTNNISLIMEPNYNSNFKCQRCDFVSYNSRAMIIHENNQMKKNSTVNYCNLCTFKSCSSSGLEKHHRKNHPGQKFQIFNESDDTNFGHSEIVQNNGHTSEVVNKVEANIHVKNIINSKERRKSVTKTQEKFYLENIKDIPTNGQVKCSRCDFVSNAANAKRHKKYHRQDLKFCEFCSFKSCSSGFLLSHKKTLHSNGTGMKSDLPIKEKIHHQCEFCEKVFKVGIALRKHRRKNHNNELQKIENQSEIVKTPFVLDIKEFEKINKSNEENHTDSIVNIENYQCEFCEKTFKLGIALKKHRMKKHTKNNEESLENIEDQNEIVEPLDDKKESENINKHNEGNHIDIGNIDTSIESIDNSIENSIENIDIDIFRVDDGESYTISENVIISNENPKNNTSHDNAEEKPILQCFRCNFSTRNPSNFKKHEKSQSNPLQICSICSFKSCSSRGHKNHYKSHTTTTEVVNKVEAKIHEKNIINSKERRKNVKRNEETTTEHVNKVEAKIHVKNIINSKDRRRSITKNQVKNYAENIDSDDDTILDNIPFHEMIEKSLAKMKNSHSSEVVKKVVKNSQNNAVVTPKNKNPILQEKLFEILHEKSPNNTNKEKEKVEESNGNGANTINYYWQSYYCDYCDKPFKFQDALHEHIKYMHHVGKTGNLPQQQKQVMLPKQNAAKVIETIVDISRPAVNFVTSKKLKEIALKKQIKSNIHHEGKNGILPQQQKVSVSNQNAVKVIETIVDISNPAVNFITEMPPLSSNQIHICDYCNGTFNSEFNLNQHVFKIHCDTNCNKCKYCDKIFAEKSDLTEHILSHHDRSLAEELQPNRIRFQDKENIENTKSLSCVFCSKSFNTTFRLKNHISNHHNKFKDDNGQNLDNQIQENYPVTLFLD